MFDSIRYVLAAVLMLLGVAAGAVSILGVFRFRFVMNRMHCAAILDTLSMAGIFGGLMVAKASGTAPQQTVPRYSAPAARTASSLVNTHII